MIPTIHTPRLAIAPLAPGDRATLASLLQNSEIKKTYMLPDFPTPEALERMLARFMELSRSDTALMRGIYREGKLIGFVNHVALDDEKIELGYVIHPAHWNRGYATEALGAMLEALFAAGFDSVKTGAFLENPASLRVMEKCGMQRCRETEEIEYRGATHTCVYYRASRPL